MGAHTPGPWVVTVGRFDMRPVIIDSDDYAIASLHSNGDPEGMARTRRGQRDADAALIAAAPDLLFQLRGAANYIDTLGGDSQKYRAAIARAEAA